MTRKRKEILAGLGTEFLGIRLRASRFKPGPAIENSARLRTMISLALQHGQVDHGWSDKPGTDMHETQIGHSKIRSTCIVILMLLLPVCNLSCIQSGDPEDSEVLVWGKRGLGDGQFQTPRAMVIDAADRLFIVDKTGRIQVFDRDGKFIRGWRIPEVKNGKPCGLGLDNEGNLLVADTHYYRVLTYTVEGKLLEERTIGGQLGHGQGEFEFLTDVVMDSKGQYFVGEYGDFDRIQKFSPEGNYLSQFGGHGSGDGQFLRPQGIAIDDKDQIWVADACNHRIQVFDTQGEQVKLIKSWGKPGKSPGQLKYPYGVALDKDGYVYVCEWGNNRIQKFDQDGNSIATWGTAGTEPGQLHQPWGFGIDSKGFIHVLDSYNNRVQRFRFEKKN